MSPVAVDARRAAVARSEVRHAGALTRGPAACRDDRQRVAAGVGNNAGEVPITNSPAYGAAATAECSLTERKMIDKGCIEVLRLVRLADRALDTLAEIARAEGASVIDALGERVIDRAGKTPPHCQLCLHFEGIEVGVGHIAKGIGDAGVLWEGQQHLRDGAVER